LQFYCSYPDDATTDKTLIHTGFFKHFLKKCFFKKVFFKNTFVMKCSLTFRQEISVTWHIVKITNFELLKKVDSHTPGLFGKNSPYPHYAVKSPYI